MSVAQKGASGGDGETGKRDMGDDETRIIGSKGPKSNCIYSMNQGRNSILIG